MHHGNNLLSVLSPTFIFNLDISINKDKVRRRVVIPIRTQEGEPSLLFHKNGYEEGVYVVVQGTPLLLKSCSAVRVTLANNFLSFGVLGSDILPHPLQSIINII
ncbi:hypothetical protein MTR_2g019800 [Medicago truncatula]|uniref:Uncharacterized protein n=1 Tax=Medicago truncatula TaxID=3880 RepID=G7IPZ4_MEDTR|nr:hypothetical protein MTR_2g019800 [Medicago truncatula]